MKITIQPKVFENFNPQLKIAFLAVRHFDNSKKLADSRHLLREMEQMVRLTFNKESLKSHHLISPWAAAKQEFGKEARHYQTSLERRLHRVLKRKSLAAADVLTNLVHYLSLKHLVPMGMDDAEKITGNLTFALAQGTEKVGLFSRLKSGAFYYRDDKEILGTKLDYWKNKKTALRPETKSALLHLEALPPVTNTELRKMIKETVSLVRSFCGGKVTYGILDKKKKTIKI